MKKFENGVGVDNKGQTLYKSHMDKVKALEFQYPGKMKSTRIDESGAIVEGEYNTLSDAEKNVFINLRAMENVPLNTLKDMVQDDGFQEFYTIRYGDKGYKELLIAMTLKSKFGTRGATIDRVYLDKQQKDEVSMVKPNLLFHISNQLSRQGDDEMVISQLKVEVMAFIAMMEEDQRKSTEEFGFDLREDSTRQAAEDELGALGILDEINDIKKVA